MNTRIIISTLTCLIAACGDAGLVAGDEGGPLSEAASELSAPTVLTTSGLLANGFTTSWDGRLSIVTQYDETNGKGKWNACVFRPQNVATTTSGATQRLNFTVSGAPAVSACSLVLQQRDEYSFTASGQRSNLIDLNALAMVPVGSPLSSPYRSTADGTASATGTSATYDLRVYSQVYNQSDLMNPVLASLPQRTMGVMRFRVIVANAGTSTASIGSVSLVEDWQPLSAGGNTINGIEPTLTADGSLMVYNSNAPDSLWYSHNPDPSNRTGWSRPKKITELYADTARINGQTLQERYPLARKQLRSNLGELYSTSNSLRGAYPWLGWEGADLFFTSTIAYDKATRGSWSVFGESTGGQVRVIDGAFRESQADSSKVLFTTALASTSTMWSPFKQLSAPSFPTVNERPVSLFFHSNGNSAAEVSFKSFFDGAYLTHLAMNRALSKITTSTSSGSQFAAERTPDTSGRNAYGELLSGARVAIFNNADAATQNFLGEHVRFKAQSSVKANIDTAALDSRNFSVELAVRPLVDLTANAANAYLFLVNVPGVANIILEENRQLNVSLVGGDGFRTGFIGTALPLNAWSHVAITWHAKTERLMVTLDARVIFDRRLVGFVVGASTGPAQVGPGGLNGAYASSSSEVLAIDEFKLSRVTRSIDEIADSAYLPLGQRSLPALTLSSAVPATQLRVMGQTFTQPVAQLGSLLFRDPRLSSNNAISCTTCHDPARFFTDGRARSRGVTGTDLDVHTPTLVNRAMGRSAHWNGRFASNGQQAWAPLTASDEMGLTVNQVVSRLTNNAAYKARFQTVFGADPSTQNIETAFGAFVSSILSSRSRYDRSIAGETTLLTADELAGRDVFFGKARCSACHNGPNFTDELFHDTGFFSTGVVGRKQVSGRAGDERKVKTPTLRNVTRTAPYLHDGSSTSLSAVLDLYIEGGGSSPDKSSELRAVTLTTTEKTQLIAFLGTLESEVTYAHAIDLAEALPGLTPPSAPNIAYSPSTWSFTRGVAITAVTPTNSGGAISSCSSSPALPTGLALSATGCVLSGTPTVAIAAASYTITAANAGGSSAKVLSLAVVAAPIVAPAISYSPSSVTLTKNVAMTSKSATNTGGAIVSCASSPALPAGLALSAACTVSGTPTVIVGSTAYRITATNSAGSSATTLTLVINDKVPVISYAVTAQTFSRGTAITPLTITNTGGAITSCTASPTLPAGLAVSATSCAISGTPTTVVATTSYTITARNTGGVDTFVLNLTVNDALTPDLVIDAGGMTLAGGQSRVASNLRLTFQTDGNLVIYSTAGVGLWATGTSGRSCASGCSAAFQRDGNLVLFQGSTAYWASGSSGATKLYVTALAPFMVIRDSMNAILWSGGALSFKPGEFMLSGGWVSRGRDVRIAFQTDGDLVVYSTAGDTLWASNTGGRSCATGCVAVFQGDGNLVLYQDGAPYWASSTVNTGAALVAQPAAPAFFIRDAAGAIVWE